MKKKNKKLHFEPTIFRDWSIAYCELAQISATQEFKKQFGWRYTDLIFGWDGKKETLYRAIEEHIHGMFNFMKMRIKKDRGFIKQISSTLLKNIKEYQKLVEGWLNLDFKKADKQEILAIFSQLKAKYLPLLPRFLIIMYFPQQLELYYQDYKEKLKRGNAICLKTRPQVDKILAPLTEEVLRKIGSYALQKVGFKNYDKFGRFLTIEEIENLLTSAYSKAQISKLKEKLYKRRKYFLFADGKVRLTPLKTYLKSRKWELIEHGAESGTRMVKGMPTYIVKRFIKGKVKIVENKEELHKIQKGDVIIAPMTTPEYAPIFRKVSAIVTDEGGITCHAAIVSRELKVPCIVGTKIATRIFQDNDYVEVNTRKGEIKLLKRK